MVAEKPSVAKLIAEILSGGRMRFRKGAELTKKALLQHSSTLFNPLAMELVSGRPKPSCSNL